MKHTISVLSLALGLTSSIQAQNIQEIQLKNGSILYGYIQHVENDGRMIIATDSAIINGNKDSVTVVRTEPYDLGTIPEWRGWAESNQAIVTVKNRPSLELSEIRIKGQAPVNQVRVIEEGETVRYFEKRKRLYNKTWDDIYQIRSERRNRAILSGIKRTYVLKDGSSYTGEYRGESPTTLQLYMDKGKIRSFKIDDVVKYVYSGINESQPLYEQSQLLDIIKRRDYSEIKGVIIEENYTSSKDTENYIRLLEENGSTQTIYMSDILETSKCYNPKCNLLRDVLLNNGEVMIADTLQKAHKVTEEKGFMKIKTPPKITTLKKQAGGKYKLTVYYRHDADHNRPLFRLVRLGFIEEHKEKIYVFDYKEMATAELREVKRETTVNGTTHAIFNIEQKGVYALYDAQGKEAYVIGIQ